MAARSSAIGQCHLQTQFINFASTLTRACCRIKSCDSFSLHHSHLESCGRLTLLDRGLVDPFRISSALSVRTRFLPLRPSLRAIFTSHSWAVQQASPLSRPSLLLCQLCVKTAQRHLRHLELSSLWAWLGSRSFWRWKTLVKSAHIDGDILTFLHLFHVKMKDFNICVSEVLEAAMKICVKFL